jgi:FixJ family two-component response regulator
VARTPEPTVYVVDDQKDVCDSIVVLLRAAGLRACAFTDPAAFLKAVRPQTPGCVLLDVRMPRLSGLEVQQRLLRRGARQPVVFVSGHGDIPMALRAVRAGALDFVEKPFRADTLLDLVRRGIEIDSRRRKEGSADDEASALVGALTRRERQVAEAVAEGLSSREIAGRLSLSVRTVEMHRARAMKALGVRGTAEMIGLVLSARSSAPGALAPH